MKKLIYIGALSTLLLVACNETTETTEQPVEVQAEVKEDKQVTYYNDETKPIIEEFLKTYDNTWNNIWVIVMDRTANNDIETSEAYTQIEKVKNTYRDLSMQNDVPTKQLSKKNKKLVKDLIEQLNMSAVNRQQAAEIAMEILETNSNAKTDKMNEKIQWSDNFMNEALKIYEELESNLN